MDGLLLTIDIDTIDIDTIDDQCNDDKYPDRIFGFSFSINIFIGKFDSRHTCTQEIETGDGVASIVSNSMR